MHRFTISLILSSKEIFFGLLDITVLRITSRYKTAHYKCFTGFGKLELSLHCQKKCVVTPQTQTTLEAWLMDSKYKPLWRQTNTQKTDMFCNVTVALATSHFLWTVWWSLLHSIVVQAQMWDLHCWIPLDQKGNLDQHAVCYSMEMSGVCCDIIIQHECFSKWKPIISLFMWLYTDM